MISITISLFIGFVYISLDQEIKLRLSSLAFVKRRIDIRMTSLIKSTNRISSTNRMSMESNHSGSGSSGSMNTSSQSISSPSVCAFF